ncbi:MAG: hypothetical protein J3K34DRAFT_454135 [Monoraphidium minutum]|nr:MAG: hypothetical protein J3K34DRAFT_454135 [Monoraphidium minutum]
MISRGLASRRIAHLGVSQRFIRTLYGPQIPRPRGPAAPPPAAQQRRRSSSSRASGAAPAAMAPPKDYSSQSNYAEVKEVARHYELDVDFERSVIEGYAKITAEAVAPSSRLVLDTRGLAVARVEALPGGAPLAFELGAPHRALGAALEITLPSGLQPGDKVEVGVRFCTSPDASALQFLAPEMTAGGRHPYLFSQCQAIHARSMVPCQDTPAIKAPYTASVRVPAALTALMSAVPDGGGGDGGGGLPGVDAGGAPAAGERRTFRFTQAVPIPSYLIALAAGELEARELSARSRVWSEPGVVDAAAYEFADTARYLDAGEEVAGPYVWGRYDLLLLPPSFPYGGMENPCLTFVTPTLLAGDRSLTNVVAHEIAHSWTGNLVTNASWSDFWLNEGWTVFLERKILGRLQGEKALQFNASRGAMQLQEEVARIGPTHNFTRLVPDLSAGEDPDDAFSRIPYEKGFYFLYYLQQLVGGPPAFEPFVKDYLKHFSFKTLTSGDFRSFFTDYFKDTPAIAGIDWDTWLHAPGMPPALNAYDDSLAAAANDLAVRWHTADVMGVGAAPPAGAGPADIEGWGSDQVVSFLSKLGELRSMTALHPSATRAMDAAYGLDAATNCEIKCEWLRLCIHANDAAAVPLAVEMVASVGRMKYLRPLYRGLYRSKVGRQAALDAFKAHKGRYHPIARKMVAVDLEVAA